MSRRYGLREQPDFGASGHEGRQAPSANGLELSMQRGGASLSWVALGHLAFGLVYGGSIVAIVYWAGADVAEQDGRGGPVVTEAGFSWVRADLPFDHFYLFEAADPATSDWARAREHAAHAYFEP